MTRRLVQAIEPFSMNIGVVPVMVARGDLYFDDDEVVRRNPHGFDDVEVKSSATGRARTSVGSVETAAAEPGVKRRMGRPPKTEVVLESSTTTSEV